MWIVIALYLACFVLSIRAQNTINDSQNLKDIFDFSNLNKDHELFSNKNKKVVCKFKIETLKNIWIDDFVASRSKAYSFKFNDENTNQLKGISLSQSKNVKYEEQ